MGGQDLNLARKTRLKYKRRKINIHGKKYSKKKGKERKEESKYELGRQEK